MSRINLLFIGVCLLFSPVFAIASNQASLKVDNQREYDYVFRLHGGGNALCTSMFQTDIDVGLEFLFRKYYGLGLQGGFAYGSRPDNRSITMQEYTKFINQQNVDIYFLYRPLSNRHSLSLGVGYSLGIYSSSDLRSPTGAFLHRMDHGILGRVQYDYVFNNGLLLGVYTQYTNYLQYKNTQDKLSIGMVFGYYF